MSWAPVFLDGSSPRISSGYGSRTDPITGAAGAWHPGIDYAAPTGTPVGAAAAGKVLAAGDYLDGYGIRVMVDHGDGWWTLYAHLSAVNVFEGDQVEEGQQLGLVGSTGRSTGPHLHFGAYQNGKPVDPSSGSPAPSKAGLAALVLAVLALLVLAVR